MANFLLVHGAFHSAWCWHALIPPLEAAGHHVMAPDLPGPGTQPLPFGEGGVMMSAARVVALLDVLEGPTVLVAHGAGSVVAMQAAAQRPSRVAGLVHITGLLLRARESISSFLGECSRMGFDAPTTRRIEITDQGRQVRLPAEAARELLYHRCPPALADEAVSRLRPQPTATYTDPLALEDGAALERQPRYYIQCGDDRAIPPALQRWMTRRTACRRIYWIDSDHAPFLSAPQALAEIVLDAAGRCLA